MTRVHLRILLLLILTFLPGIAYSYLRLSVVYTYHHIAAAEAVYMKGYMDFETVAGGIFATTEYIKGYEMLLIAWKEISGIPFPTLQFVPLGSLIVPLSYFTLARRASRSFMISAFLAIYISYDGSVGTGLYSIFPHVLGYMFYFLFLLLFFTRERTRTQEIALLILFAGASLIHYTVPVWIIATVVLTALAIRVSHCRFPYKDKSLSPFVAYLIVIYLTLNKVIFYRLEFTEYGMVERAISSFFSKVLSYARLYQQSAEYEYFAPANEMLGVIRLALLIALMIPVLTSLLISTGRVVKRSRAILRLDDKKNMIWWTGIGVAILDAFMYSTAGVFSVKYLLVFFPFLAIMSVKGSRYAERLVKPYSALILILAFASLPLTASSYERRWAHTGAMASAYWLLNRTTTPPNVLSDLYSTGAYLLAGTSLHKFIVAINYYPSVYGNLLHNSSKLAHIARYLVIDFASLERPLLSVEWSYYQPLSNYLPNIYGSATLQKNYDNGASAIFLIG